MQNKNLWWVIGGVVVLVILAIVLGKRGGEQIPSQAGLPEAVESKRQAIYAAAAEGDYEKLQSLADPAINYSFGGSVPGGFAEYLKASDENLKADSKTNFGIIRTLLRLPYGIQGNIYVWPKVFTKSAAEWTEEDLGEMRAFLTDEEIEGFRSFGAYAGHRVGITKEGNWVYYVAGD